MRSVASHVIVVTAFGNWNVERRVWEDRSQTLTEWSRDDVKTLFVGKIPKEHEMSVIGKVWSESVQYVVASSFWRSLSTSLRAEGENVTSIVITAAAPRYGPHGYRRVVTPGNQSRTIRGEAQDIDLPVVGIPGVE